MTSRWKLVVVGLFAVGMVGLGCRAAGGPIVAGLVGAGALMMAVLAAASRS